LLLLARSIVTSTASTASGNTAVEAGAAKGDARGVLGGRRGAGALEVAAGVPGVDELLADVGEHPGHERRVDRAAGDATQGDGASGIAEHRSGTAVLGLSTEPSPFLGPMWQPRRVRSF
jgi:hypothetical protein